MAQRDERVACVTFRSRFYLVELHRGRDASWSWEPTGGDSYCAFCQAVDSLELESAVHSPWTPGTGDSSLRRLRRGDCPRAAARASRRRSTRRFSTLLARSTFDAAVRRPSTTRLDRPAPHRRDATPTRPSGTTTLSTWLPKLSVARESSLSARHRERRGARLRGVAALGRGRERVPKLRVRPWARGLGLLLVGSEQEKPVLAFFESARKQPDAVRGRSTRSVSASSCSVRYSGCWDKSSNCRSRSTRLDGVARAHEATAARNEARAEAAGARLATVAASRSWRLTAPYRRFAGFVQQSRRRARPPSDR